MNEKIAAFDIEIATLVPEGETDWKQHRPLGITCAAITTPRGTWTYAAKNEDGTYAERMTDTQCDEIVDALEMLYDYGYQILTWNGLGFDFDILAEESDRDDVCKFVAMSDRHIDMMFHFFCSRGYPVGLDAVSKGLGLPGKPEGIDGAKAPELWLTDPERVISYVQSDARQTLEVYQRSLVAGGGNVYLSWIARSGRENTWYADRWLSVAEALELPQPDTRWMSESWPRSKFHGWAAEKNNA